MSFLDQNDISISKGLSNQYSLVSMFISYLFKIGLEEIHLFYLYDVHLKVLPTEIF